mgnify:CR=1 FL=1
MIYACGSGENTSTETTESAEKAEMKEMERSAWENRNMVGKVKTIVETPYTPAEDGTIADMDSCCVEMIEFSENGYRTGKTEKNKDGEVTAVNVVEHTETGKFVSSTWTEDGKEVWKRVVKRDAEGKALGATDTDSTQQVTRRHKAAEYNEYNQPVSGTTYLADSTYLGKWTYDYDDGYEIGRSWTDSSGVQLMEVTGELNENGWLAKAKVMRVDESGEATTTLETYTYDELDEMGNWTQRTEYNDEKPVEVLKRTYTYYEK